MNKTIIFIFSAAIFIFGGTTNAFAQCGPAGLDPCIITKPLKSATKAIIKKANTVKKSVVSDGNKKSQTRSAQTKTKTNTNKNGKSTSILDSLRLEPEAKSASDSLELFPISGVTIGETTESQLELLGGEREIFDDTSTGTQRVYYTLNDMNFWMRDGVADSVGIYKFLDRIPPRWTVAGFSFQLSYNESIKLLKDKGYNVETAISLPKLEEIGKKNTTARVTGTKNGEVPLRVTMNFLFDGGKSLDSKETLLYIFVGVKR